ncbi:MAG: fused MFS/spermidine synthase [Kineosporiaceae bacterium]|nr:fused MFS/spermidine synthase [Kineosporiaceae bacterium]
MPTHRVTPRPVAGTRAVSTGLATLIPDSDGRRGWTLYLNGMESSHVDLDDPGRLDFEYLRWVVAGIESLPLVAGDPADPASGAGWRVLHLGGGGCTLPRYLATTHPRCRQVVVELDPGVLELAKQAFGLRSRPGLRLRVGEARATVTAEQSERYDVVVRDAFTGSTVPPPLLTRQFVAEVARILTPQGIYLANLADGELLATARREVATALGHFPHVALVAEPGQLRGRRYGNVVIAASAAPLPSAAWVRRLASDPVRARLVDGEAAVAFASGRAPFDDAEL